MKISVFVGSVFLMSILSTEAFARRGGGLGMLGAKLSLAGWAVPYIIASVVAMAVCMIATKITMPKGVPFALVGAMKREGVTEILYRLSQLMMIAFIGLLVAGFFWH